MLDIINQYPPDMDKKTAYKLMNSNSTQKMSDYAGSVIQVVAWCIFEDEDRIVLSIMTDDAEIIATVSATFIGAFEKMVDHFGADEVSAIKVVSGTSKAGREFITCDID